MAVPRKGWRPIVVAGVRYYWRAIGTDFGINVVVVTADAFTPGATAQQLSFRLHYDHLHVPRGGGATSLHQRAAVAPGVIRAAVEAGVALHPPFTGKLGDTDVILGDEVVETLQRLARVAATE